MLAFSGAGVVYASDDDSAPKFRNPIEWLLNDLGRMFSGAVSEITRKAEPGPVQVVDKSADPTPEGIPPEPAPLHDTNTAAGTERTGIRKAAEDKNFRNPIAWLFSDLARIFQPDLEIEQTPRHADKAKLPDDKSAERTTVAAAAEPPQPQSPEIAAETEATQDIPADKVTSDRSPNPITWLFRDLARLFSPATDGTEAAAVVSAIEPTIAAKPAVVDLNGPDPALREPARGTQDAEPQISDITAPAKTVEVAPWVPHPKKNPFDPSESLFASNGVPLLPASVPDVETDIAPSVVQTAEVTEVHEHPDIRKRAPYRPEHRNRATLGQDHKAVTPEPDDGSLVDRVLEDIFGIDAPVEAEETVANKVSDRIVPEEKLDLGYASPDAFIPDQETTRLEDGPITQLDLYMGKDSTIGTPYDAAAFEAGSCVERALHGSVFCLKDLNWPARIASSFAADTAFLIPGEGVVRYENGAASRVYAVFKAQDFAEVVKFMQQRFGPPQEREIGWMHMLEAPKLPNTTFRWQAFSADRRDAIVLEVRNYDDLRRSFADMEHGMVRLFRVGSRPIFKHISTMDLMLIQRRRIAHAPVEVNAPPKQQ